MPDLLTKVEALMEKHGLEDQRFVMRMTGCPNGCARPYAAEIGLVGKSAGHYNLHIGGDKEGYRLNTLYKEEVDEATILAELDAMLAAYAKEGGDGESFGDFTKRNYLDKVAA